MPLAQGITLWAQLNVPGFYLAHPVLTDQEISCKHLGLCTENKHHYQRGSDGGGINWAVLRTPRQQCKQEGRANGQASAATDNSCQMPRGVGPPDLLHEDFMTDSKPTASYLPVLPVPLVAQKPSSSGAYSLYPLPSFPPPFLESPLSSSSSVRLCGCWLCNHRARHSRSDLP